MAGEDLHRHGKHPQQARSGGGLLDGTVDGQKQERGPDHGAEVGQVPRVDVKEAGRAENKLGARQEAGQRVQAPSESPEVEEKPAKKGVKRDAPIDGLCQGKHEVKDVQWVKQRRLKTGQKRSPAVDVRIPEREVSPGNLPEAKAPPVHKLRGQVRIHAGKHRVVDKEQHIEKRGKRKDQQAQRAEIEAFDAVLTHVNLRHSVEPGAPRTAFR